MRLTRSQSSRTASVARRKADEDSTPLSVASTTVPSQPSPKAAQSPSKRPHLPQQETPELVISRTRPVNTTTTTAPSRRSLTNKRRRSMGKTTIVPKKAADGTLESSCSCAPTKEEIESSSFRTAQSSNNVEEPLLILGQPIVPPQPRTKKKKTASTDHDDNDNDDETPPPTLPNELVLATLVARPSKRNKSPYVGDVQFPTSSLSSSQERQEERGSLPQDALVHLPSLVSYTARTRATLETIYDSYILVLVVLVVSLAVAANNRTWEGCRPGVTVAVLPARHPRTKQPVGPNDVSPKYGTPKCQYFIQLVQVVEENPRKTVYSSSSSSSNNNKEDDNQQSGTTAPPSQSFSSCWVGAHPRLGEEISQLWLHQPVFLSQMLQKPLEDCTPDKIKVSSQVTNPGGVEMRADFVLEYSAESKKIWHVVEVKTVVDTDYAASAPVPATIKCVYRSAQDPPLYRRAAIFPWGSGNQKGPLGEPVVSARAIKHLQSLTRLVTKPTSSQTKNHGGVEYRATLLFVVVRGDAVVFRPNYEACPTFAKTLAAAELAGVQVVAKQVRWEYDEKRRQAFAFANPEHIEETYFMPIDWKF